MLSPIVEEATYALARAEEKGKGRDETKESCNFELLTLLKDMKV